MGVKDMISRFRDRTNPDRAADKARREGKSETEVADEVHKAERRKKLLKSGGAGGGSFGG